MTAYRNIDSTPLADADRLASGQGIALQAWQGKTLGFFGRDLGSAAPSQGRVPAFLGLAERTGGVYVENAPSVGEALRQTGLDFEVRHNPLTASRQEEVLSVDDEGMPSLVQQETGEHLDVPGWAATVAYPRDGGQPFALGVTGERYTIVQTEEALSVGDAISGGTLVALGAYGRPTGSKVYAAFELGDGFTIGGGDPYRSFVTITTSHDRSQSLTALMAPIRLGCTNQTTATFGRRATPRYTVRHTGSASVKVEEARAILGVAHEYVEAYREGAEELLGTPMTRGQFLDSYAPRVWGVDPDAELTPRQLTRVEARTEQLAAILDSDTCEFGRGTAYAGFQAVVEYLDFFGTVRGGHTGADLRRYERLLTGELDTAKERAWNLALV